MKFTTSHNGLVRWLRDHFGHLAQNKLIPGWVFGLDRESRQTLLDGYFAGDGYTTEATPSGGNILTTSSVSRALSLGIRLLAESLGHRTSMYFGQARPTQIEGRVVDNVRDSYHVRWRTGPVARPQAVAGDLHAWSGVREVCPGRADVTVYNLSVDEDESYIAEGIVVHNCTDFSKAKGGKPKRKHIRALADVGLVWAGKRRPAVITLENVEEFRQWGPLIHKPAKGGGYLWHLARRHKRMKLKQRDNVAGPHHEAAGAADWEKRKSRGGWKVEPTMIPDPDRRGHEYARWVRELEGLGYVVEARELRACDYGTPTTRKRLFVVARCDGKPIRWPEPTHGNHVRVQDRRRGDDGRHRRAEGRHPQAGRGGRRDVRGTGQKVAALQPYRTAAECIDWDQPMLSIFATRADARRWAAKVNAGRPKADHVGVPQRPLKPKTQARIAGGLDKWVLKAAEPFVVSIANYGWDTGADGRPAAEPLSTVTAHPKGGRNAAVDVGLAASFAGTFNHGGPEHRTNDVRGPLATVTAANDARGVVGVGLAPTVVRVAHGDETAAGKPRWGDSSHAPGEPLPTVTASKDFAVAGATLTPFTVPRHGERAGQAPRSGSVDRPLPTVTGTDNGAQLVAVALNKHYTGVVGQSAAEPIGTVTGIDHHSAMAVHLTKYHGAKGDEARGQPADEPIRTLDTENRFGVVAAHLTQFYGRSVGQAADEPSPTVTGSVRHTGVVSAHLIKFRGESPGTAVDAPVDTITAGSNTGRP
jgi:site-specific DNA-cytosine methylase